MASESQLSWKPPKKYTFTTAQKRELAQYLPRPESALKFFSDLSQAAIEKSIDVEFLVINDLELAMNKLRLERQEEPCVWIVSDGRIFHNSASLGAWLRFLEFDVYGIDTTIQSLTDNKYLMSVIASKHGIKVPNSYLYRANKRIAHLEGQDFGEGYFVKPNTLGSQVGISHSSKVPDLNSASELSELIFSSYGVDAIVQSYIPGSDHRVSVVENNMGLSFSCSKITVFNQTGEVEAFSTNRTVVNRKWKTSAIGEKSKASIEGQQMTSIFQGLGMIKDYCAIDIRGNERDGYFFLENNVKPFVDDSFLALAEKNGFKSTGELFLSSILRKLRLKID